MTMNVKQSASLIALAREKKRFIMEGRWTRFFPSIRFVRKLLEDNEIGEVRHVHAEIGYLFLMNEARLWQNQLGGGGLLDIGMPSPPWSSARNLKSDQRFATIEYSMLVQLSETVTISGTTGRIHIHAPAHLATEVSVIRAGGPGKEDQTTKQFPWPNPDNGYSSFLYEGEAVTKTIRSKKTEADEYSLDESLGIVTIMDSIRKDIRLVYPADAK